MVCKKQITATLQAKKYPKNFYIENGLLMCYFCFCIVNHDNISFITTHLNTKKHITKKEKSPENEQHERQRSIQTTMQVAEPKKSVINEFLKAWVSANIPLEKVDKF